MRTKSTKAIRLLIMFGLTLLFSQIHAQLNEGDMIYANQEFEAQIDQAVELIYELMKTNSIPGLSIAVATENEIVWAQGFGFADLENKTSVKLNSKFRIGSISKTLTALAIGKLIDDYEINLSDEVHKYVAYLPKKKYPITIGQLASHTAGIRDYDYKTGEFFSDKNYKSVEESIDIFKDDSLLFEPGSQYSYSTYGYVLLSAVIEGVTQMDYNKFMLDSILVPMKMVNTLPDYNYDIIENRVRFYDKMSGRVINGYHVNNSNKWAGGGYLSTSLDLVRMCRVLLNKEFLYKTTKQLLWTPATLSNGEKTNYGIGWRINKDYLNRMYVHHGGSSIGGRSFLLLYPNEGLAIAVTCNLSTDFNQEFVLKIAELFVDSK